MVAGATVIFNNDYIAELVRHTEIAKKKADVEDLPEKKEHAKKVYENWENKLDWARGFRDTIEQVINCEVPNITVVKTISGYEFPAKILEIV